MYLSLPPIHRFESSADEVNSNDREIVFTIFDGRFSANDSITMEIQVVNDNPATVRAHYNVILVNFDFVSILFNIIIGYKLTASWT